MTKFSTQYSKPLMIAVALSTSIMIGSPALNASVGSSLPETIDIERYGGKRGDAIFKIHQTDAVQYGADFIASIRDARDVTQDDVKKLISDLAKRRGNAAEKANSESADQFGKRRGFQNAEALFQCHVTGLTEPRVHMRTEVAKTMKRALTAIMNGEPGTRYVEADSRYVYQVGPVRVEFLPPNQSYPRSDEQMTTIKLAAMLGDKDAMELVIENMLIKHMFGNARGDAERFINLVEEDRCVTAKLTYFANRNGKQIPLTTFMTAFEKANDTLTGLSPETLEEIGTTTVMGALHTESKDISTLEEVAHVFALKAINWDGGNPATLHTSIAILRYYLSHAMPFERGSAAITNWIVGSILKSHGLQENAGDWGPIDDYSMGMPFTDFLSAYKENVTVDK